MGETVGRLAALVLFVGMSFMIVVMCLWALVVFGRGAEIVLRYIGML